MEARPSPIAEAIIGACLPPACREEVLGDLHERYQSSTQYLLDAFHTIPLVLASQVLRTTRRHVEPAGLRLNRWRVELGQGSVGVCREALWRASAVFSTVSYASAATVARPGPYVVAVTARPLWLLSGVLSAASDRAMGLLPTDDEAHSDSDPSR